MHLNSKSLNRWNCLQNSISNDMIGVSLDFESRFGIPHLGRKCTRIRSLGRCSRDDLDCVGYGKKLAFLYDRQEQNSQNKFKRTSHFISSVIIVYSVYDLVAKPIAYRTTDLPASWFESRYYRCPWNVLSDRLSSPGRQPVGDAPDVRPHVYDQTDHALTLHCLIRLANHERGPPANRIPRSPRVPAVRWWRPVTRWFRRAIDLAGGAGYG